MKPRILSTARISLPLASALAAMLASSHANAQSFTDTVSTGAWNTSRWNNTADASPYTSAFTANNAVNFTTGTYSIAGMGAAINVGNVTLSDNVTVNFTAASSTYATGGFIRTIDVGTNSLYNMSTQAFSAATGTGFIKTGAGTWVSGAGAAYTGGFTVNAGTVALAGVNGMGAGGALTINGGTIRSSATNARDLTGKYTGGITIGGDFTLGDAVNNGTLTFTNNMALGATNRTITIASDAVFGGVISGSSGVGLTKTGDGVLYLTNAVGNTWTGGTTISAGGLSFRTTAAVPTTGTHAFGTNSTLGLGVGTGGFTTAQVNAALTGTAPAANITLNAGTRIGIDTGAGAFDFNTSLAASSRGLDKLGGNNLTLSADNSSYDGDIRIVLTRIVVTHSNALGSTVGSTTVLGGGGTSTSANTLDFQFATTDLTMAEKLNFFGNAAGRARLALANNAALTHTLSGAIDVTSDANIPEWNSGGTSSLAAFKITGDITGTFSGAATGLLLRGNAHGTPASTPINKIEGNVTLSNFGINKTDSGTWLIGASGKTYKAPALGVANGLLLMGADNYLDTVTPVRLDMGAATGGTTGKLDLNGFSQTVAGINLLGSSGDKAITSSSGTPVLTVDNATDYTTGSLVALTGSLGLTKDGVGKQTLGAVNTYNGNTTITGGTLAISGTGSINNTPLIQINSSTTLDVTGLTAGTFTIGSTQTVAGGGTILATGKTVVASGTLSPGNSPGTLTQDGVGSSLQLGVGGHYNWQVLNAAGAAGTGYDTTNLINAATLDLSLLSAGNTYNINLWSLSAIGPDTNGDASSFDNTLNYSWTLFSTGDAISGFSTDKFTINTGAFNGTSGFSNALGGGTFSVGLADSDTDLVLKFTAVPEPRAALLGGLGVLALLRRRR